MSSAKTSRKRFFIIDGYALLFRAHFALIRNPLITSYGLNTSALFGFINQLLKIIKDENPEYFACAFDSKGKTFRHEMYKEYKANRPPMPEELQQQLPHLWEILEAMNIPVLKKVGVEADDIIGTLAVRAQKKGLDTYIVSGDKDFMQLINKNIFLYAPGTKKSPNFEETVKVADTSNCPVIISGGVSSMDDIKKAKELNNKNIEGIIVGKAIYDGDIKLDELAKEVNA